MKGITAAIPVIMLIIIVAGSAVGTYTLFSNYMGFRVSKTISSFDHYCSFNSGSVLINNDGKNVIELVDPAVAEFETIGNMVPNPGFELDADGDGHPDGWGDVDAEFVDVVLVTDLSNSMQECSDSDEIQPDQDTVLIMHFNEDNDPVDFSGWGNDGTRFGATLEPEGRFGGGLRTGFQKYVEIPHDDSLAGFTNFTIEAWINISSFTMPIGTTTIPIVKKGDEYQLRLYKYSGSDMGLSVKRGGTGLIWPYLFSADTMYHVAVTMKATSPTSGHVRLFVDGKVLGWNTISNVPPSTGDVVEIGRGEESFKDTYFYGMIDEVAIYRRALTDKEIESHYNKTMTNCPSDGRPDMPGGCSYETTHCPSAVGAGREEVYFSGIPSTFSTIDFSPLRSTTITTTNCVSGVKGCDPSVCATQGPGWIMKSESTSTSTCQGSNCCPAGDCDGGTVCAGNSIEIPCGSSCTSPYFCLSPSLVSTGNCYYDSVASCSLPSDSDCNDCYTLTSSSEQTSIRDSCNPDEVSCGVVCREDGGCYESTCPGGGPVPDYDPCPSCGTCAGATEVYCCRDPDPESLTQDVCRKYDITCCEYKKKCYDRRDEVCEDTEYECCEPFTVCELTGARNPVSECTPGFITPGQPAPPACSGQMCAAEGGSCYLCKLVPLRLVKKLDTEFVRTVVNKLAANIGLVGYNSVVTSWTNLTTHGSDLYGNISLYSAGGETCLSCAVKKSLEILDNSDNKKYMVLMSDGVANVRDYYTSSDWNGDGKVNAKDDAIARACVYNNNQPDDRDVIYYTIGFGLEAGLSTLQKIAECSRKNATTGQSLGKYFHGSSPEELEDIYKQISILIGKASLDKVNKVYGDLAMLLLAGSTPSFVTSDPFKIMHDDVVYDLSFYSTLNITAGEFTVLVFFFDDNTIFNVTEAGSFTTSHYQFRQDKLRMHIPAGSKKAAFMFLFNESGPLDRARIDDVYFGPPITCQKEGDGWRCGDLFVEKLTFNGDMYPYFKTGEADPGKSTIFKDGNCRGHCRYKVISPSNIVTVDLIC